MSLSGMGGWEEGCRGWVLFFGIFLGGVGVISVGGPLVRRAGSVVVCFFGRLREQLARAWWMVAVVMDDGLASSSLELQDVVVVQGEQP